MCGGGVCSILFLPLVARCLETIDVYIWHISTDYVQVTHAARSSGTNGNTSMETHNLCMRSRDGKYRAHAAMHPSCTTLHLG